MDLVGRTDAEIFFRFSALLIYIFAMVSTVFLSHKMERTTLKFISVLIDGLAFVLLAFLPQDMDPFVALYPIFFATAFQWCSFKGADGFNSSSIFSTNNLRQFTTAVTQFLMKKDSAQCDKAKFYGMTLLSFHTGAALSLILYMTCGLSGVWLCLVPAFYAVWLISADRNTADTPAVTRSSASACSSFRNLSYKKKEA